MIVACQILDLPRVREVMNKNKPKRLWARCTEHRRLFGKQVHVQVSAGWTLQDFEEDGGTVCSACMERMGGEENVASRVRSNALWWRANARRVEAEQAALPQPPAPPSDETPEQRRERIIEGVMARLVVGAFTLGS